MSQLYYVDFSQDLNQHAFRHVADPSYLVFPSRVAAQSAWRSFLPGWQLQNAQFLSMEEFRDLLFVPSLPELQDEKRLLCLWQVLSKDDREAFNLYRYQDIISWGGRFLDFFEEMQDELVSVEYLAHEAPLEIAMREWQEEHLTRILDIRQRYLDFITRQGFTDKMFYLQPDAMRIPDSPCRVVFVNQYYFSALEKRIVRHLEEQGFEITIIHQGPQDSFDLDTLTSREVRLEELEEDQFRLRNLHFAQYNNQMQMALACLSEYGRRKQAGEYADATQKRLLVDPSFGSAAYTRFFDPSGFKQPASPTIQHSQLFQLLQLFGRHLRAMAEARQKGFILISEIARALAQPGFVAYYQPDWGEGERSILLNDLRQLANRQVLYIDMDLQVFEDLKKECRCLLLPTLLQPHFALLRKLATIDSLQAMIDLFDEPGALMIRQLCSEEELDYTDILHKYYERLDNFRMAEKLGLVKDWRHIYDTKDSALAADIWQLWLDSLQTARIKDNTATPRPIYDFSSLFDTRNLSFDEVIVLNSIEGQLPQNPEPVWLFNEKQLERMKLKHYDLIRKWERYYFLRLLLSSTTVYLYAYRDGEKDLEPGSYFTELSHFLAKEDNWSQVVRHSTPIQVKDEILGKAQRELAKEHDKVKWLAEAGIKDPASDIESFLRLPCDEGKDFDGELKTSFYGLNRLTANPFAWYIQYKAGLDECNLLPEETVNPMLFGNIMHSYFGKVLRPIQGEHKDVKALESAFAKQTLTQELEGILQSKEYLYKIPKNYNLHFLSDVMLQLLVSSVRAFYDNWLKPKLEGKNFRIIPEKDYQQDKSEYKTLLSFGKGDRYALKVKGRADLLVNTSETDYIIDFKTGSQADVNQLFFYEFFLYRHDEVYLRRLESLFWMLKEDKSKNEGVKKEEVYNGWKSDIDTILTGCLAQGYGIGNTTTDRKHMAAITRADLYRRPGKKEGNNETV